jgi:uncharacterized protein (DUF433 family)
MQLITHLFIQDDQAYIVGRGHLKAEMVARMYVDGDYRIEDVMEHYQLSAAAVYAALSYYYDNRAELDRVHEQKWADIAERVPSSADHLAELRRRRQDLHK